MYIMHLYMQFNENYHSVLRSYFVMLTIGCHYFVLKTLVHLFLLFYSTILEIKNKTFWFRLAYITSSRLTGCLIGWLCGANRDFATGVAAREASERTKEGLYSCSTKVYSTRNRRPLVSQPGSTAQHWICSYIWHLGRTMKSFEFYSTGHRRCSLFWLGCAVSNASTLIISPPLGPARHHHHHQFVHCRPNSFDRPLN